MIDVARPEPSFHILRARTGEVAIHLADVDLREGLIVDVEIGDRSIVLRQGEREIDLGDVHPTVMGVVAPATEITILEFRERPNEHTVLHQARKAVA